MFVCACVCVWTPPRPPNDGGTHKLNLRRTTRHTHTTTVEKRVWKNTKKYFRTPLSTSPRENYLRSAITYCGEVSRPRPEPRFPTAAAASPFVDVLRTRALQIISSPAAAVSRHSCFIRGGGGDSSISQWKRFLQYYTEQSFTSSFLSLPPSFLYVPSPLTTFSLFSNTVLLIARGICTRFTAFKTR